jgi:hypothetical protein
MKLCANSTANGHGEHLELSGVIILYVHVCLWSISGPVLSGTNANSVPVIVRKTIEFYSVSNASLLVKFETLYHVHICSS